VTNTPILLQLCPFAPEMEAGLRENYEVARWFDIGNPHEWLAENAPRVRAVATGGHLGIPTDLMNKLPSLGLVAINGVGFDKVDLGAAKARGVRVTTTPDVLTDDVADLAVGLIIAQFRCIPAGDAHVRAGMWPNAERPLGRKVSGSRFGIFGLGKIGSAIAERLAPFGPISYCDLQAKDVPYRYVTDLITLARDSDVLVLASAANAATAKMINGKVLRALGANGVLVNVARGSIVDEEALIASLEAKSIAGAALDVFAAEPNVPEQLRSLDQVVLTPHIASATKETRQAMADIVVRNVNALLTGAPLFGELSLS